MKLVFMSFLLWSFNALALGPEVVEVVNVASVQVSSEDKLKCYSSSIKRPECFQGVRYKVVFKRKNGMSDSVVLPAYFTGKKMVVHFCPGRPGEVEKPCQ
jgi:hypothetical protein